MSLKKWRVDAGLSQEALGEKLLVSAVAISRYEKGRIPESPVLQRIIKLTSGAVTANDFFEMPRGKQRQADRGRTNAR